MKLSDYVKSLQESVEETLVSLTKSSDGNLQTEINSLIEKSENKWIGKRLSDNSIYLFNNKHYINITNLRNEIAQLYASKGFTGSGFDKLTEEELCVYKTVKEIFVQLISQSLGPELSPKETAQSLFDREIFYA
jgi:hypothetical protein